MYPISSPRLIGYRISNIFSRGTAKGRVIYLALEEKRAKVRAHFRQMGASGLEPIEVLVAPAPDQALGALHTSLAEQRATLVIIDPLLKFVRVNDLNDYAEVTAALEPLHILARETGTHILLVHHLPKLEGLEVGDAMLGSTALLAAVDTGLELRRRDHARTLRTIQRYGEDLPERMLQFDALRGLLSLGPEKAEADREAMKEEILTHLERRGEETEPDIMQAVDGTNAVKRVALRELVKQGRVQRSGEGRKGAPYKYSYARTDNICGTSVQESAE